MTTTHPVLKSAACAALLALAAVGCSGGGDGSGRAETPRRTATVRASPSATAHPFRQVPSSAECRRVLGSACYTPDLVRTAYGIDRLNSLGLTGEGRTVVVYEQVVPDTLRRDLETFSQAMKLPKPELTVDRYDPAGRIAPFDPKNSQLAVTAMETTLDVQMVHMVAPEAKIVVTQIGLPAAVYRPGPSPSGTPEPTPDEEAARQAADGAAVGAGLILDGIADSLNRHHPDAISISFGVEEYTAAGNSGRPAQNLARFSGVLAQIVAGGVSLVASAGDSGAAPPIGPHGERVKSVSWPASDPSVLSLGASRLHLDDQGRRTGPDTVWHDQYGATGGGPSQTFTRPAYQDGVEDRVGGRRGTPDICMDGSASGGTLIYQGFLPAGPGWVPVGGTSEAAPMFAAVIALADQKAGRRLGAVHGPMYGLQNDPSGGVIDITVGNNGPDGYQAVKGYDMASGLGTIDASAFVPKLAATATG
ncbi:S8 family serine peptidase [Streptomyces sp. NPDC056161]|uniref:S53 family peptidase n=1 Tax=Streptomyces sp. NPDC056161 TaxID=3345732 RepID=UPI0035DF4E11